MEEDPEEVRAVVRASVAIIAVVVLAVVAIVLILFHVVV